MKDIHIKKPQDLFVTAEFLEEERKFKEEFVRKFLNSRIEPGDACYYVPGGGMCRSEDKDIARELFQDCFPAPPPKMEVIPVETHQEVVQSIEKLADTLLPMAPAMSPFPCVEGEECCGDGDCSITMEWGPLDFEFPVANYPEELTVDLGSGEVQYIKAPEAERPPMSLNERIKLADGMIGRWTDFENKQLTPYG